MGGQINTFSFRSSNWNRDVLVGCRNTAGNTLVLGSTCKPEQTRRFVPNYKVTVAVPGGLVTATLTPLEGEAADRPLCTAQLFLGSRCLSVSVVSASRLHLSLCLDLG